jgi:hypothetical protein
MSLGAFSGTFTTHKIRARGPNSAKFEQSSGSGPTESPRAPREVAWLARACAVGMRRSGSSRELAIAACRAAQQEPRVPRVEFRMKKMTRALRLALCAPGPRRNVGSCPAAKFARGPEIRAMQCACCNRGKGRARGAPWLAGESRTSTRAWQAYSPAPKEKTRACARCPFDRLSAPRAASCRSILRTGHG